MHRIAFLYPTLFQAAVNPLHAPDILKPAQRLIVAKICHGDEFFQRLAADDKIAPVVARDRDALRIFVFIRVIDLYPVRFLRFLDIAVQRLRCFSDKRC